LGQAKIADQNLFDDMMGDEMNFPNEIWIYDYEGQRWQQKEDASQQRYIHESRVPTSCGGTMEENDANALARAQERDSVRILEDDRFTREQIRNNNATTTVLTSGSADTQGQAWGGKP
jgi:hypothetical protein